MFIIVYQVIVAASKNRLAWESFARVWTEISYWVVSEPKNILYVIAILYSNLFLAVIWLVQQMRIQYCYDGDFYEYTCKRFSGKPIFCRRHYYLINNGISYTCIVYRVFSTIKIQIKRVTTPLQSVAHWLSEYFFTHKWKAWNFIYISPLCGPSLKWESAPDFFFFILF